MYIFIDAGDQVALSGYRFTTANDTKNFSGRNPVTWSLLGSNTKSDVPNSEEWTLIDRREEDNTLDATNYTPYDFTIQKPVIPGDVNGDSEVDLADAIMVTYYSLHEVPSNFNEAAADMNGDGEIDLSDATIIINISLEDQFAIEGKVSVQEGVSVNDITLPQGGETFLEINYSLEGEGPYVGFMFQIDLPENISLADDSEKPNYPWYDESVTSIQGMNISATPTVFAGTPQTLDFCLNGNGVLMRVKVAADTNMDVGSTYTGKITGLSFYVRDEAYNITKISLYDITFDITIEDKDDAIVLPRGDTEEGAIYNLAGQRLNKIQKGVNITNGRKILK